MKSRLIIFVKNPELGKVKTRLASTIGDEKALEVYKLLLEKTHLETASLDVDKVVYYSNRVDCDDLWNEGAFTKGVQAQGDLGAKMTSAFQEAFEEGFERVCVIGSDAYDLTQSHIESAFEKLLNANAVVGPAKDGGYYLLGMSRLYQEVFQNKSWSTDSVYNDTIEDFESLGLNYHVLPTLSDVDTEKDLGTWAKKVI